MLLTESYYVWIQLDSGQTGPERRKQIRSRKTRDDSFRHEWEGSLSGHVALWLGDMIKKNLTLLVLLGDRRCHYQFRDRYGLSNRGHSHLFPTSLF